MTDHPLLRKSASPDAILVDNQNQRTAMDDPTPPPTEKLKQRRHENDIRWLKLQELYRRLPPQHIDDGSARKNHHAWPQSRTSLDDALQIELDILPRSRWAIESDHLIQKLIANDNDDHGFFDVNHPDCKTLLFLEPFAKEVIQNYRHLKQVNVQLQQDIDNEQYRLQELIAFRDELLHLQSELQQDYEDNDTTQQQSEESNKRRRSNHHQSRSDDGDIQDTNSQQLHNSILRSDIQYVAECIEQQYDWGNNYNPTTSDDETAMEQSPTPHGEGWSLNRLLCELVEHLLHAPSDTANDSHTHILDGGDHNDQYWVETVMNGNSNEQPRTYLSSEVYLIRSEHVELLLHCNLVESHDDDDGLIRLLDYRK